MSDDVPVTMHPERLIAELRVHLAGMALRQPTAYPLNTLADVYGHLLDAMERSIRDWHELEARYLATRPLPFEVVIRDGRAHIERPPT